MEDPQNLKEPLLPNKDPSNMSFAEAYQLQSAFERFKKANKAFWYIANITLLFVASGLIYGTFYIVENSQDCGNIVFILYVNIILHSLNIMVALINICGFETKVFNCNIVCGLVIF